MTWFLVRSRRSGAPEVVTKVSLFWSAEDLTPSDPDVT